MASPPDSFFQRLTRLFQSGPAIQRRVKGYDPKNILGNQMQHGNLTYRTTAPFGFGKDSSQFGGMGSYGIVDRMSRYSDFLSMEYCLAGNTKIATPGGYKTIKQLSEEYGLDKEFLVYSYDVNTRRIVPSIGKQARKTRTDHAWEVTFNNGKKIIGTANHRLLKRDGTFCQIENLTVGDSMMPFDRKMFIADKSRITKLLQQSKKIKKDNELAGRKDITFGRILETCEKIGFELDKICLAFDTDKKTIELHLMKFGYRDFEIFTTSYKTNPALIKDLNKKTVVTFDKICKAYESGMHYRELIAKLNCGTNKHVIFKKLKEYGFMSWKDMKTFYNDLKITDIKYHGVIDLYDLTVDGHKNFATNTVISHNTPEIASALDIYSDEMVGGDDRGKCFHVYSDNTQIKRALDELFYDVINVEFNLRPWARNLVKFGDSFIVLEVIPDVGVVNAMSVPVAEIEREEGYNREDPYAVRFKWITRGNKYLENWQVCHFRILSNDLHGQYGTSVLESSRSVWRKLVLLEDAMLTYRVVRSPERRVFYIDVANVPPNDVEAYMEAVKSTLKSNSTVDRQTGREDLRYNAQPIAWDSVIPLLDGRNITIKELAEEYDSGKTNWVHSISDKTTELLPGKVIWCGKNYTAQKMVKVTLDDGSVVKTAPEHPFILRNNTPCRADELREGDSLMPFYRNYKTASGKIVLEDNKLGYPNVYDPMSEKYKTTHKIVSDCALQENKKLVIETLSNNPKNKFLVVHHKNFKKHDATPINLEWLGDSDHTMLHHKLNHTGFEKLMEYTKSEENKKRVTENNIKLGLGKKLAENYNGTELHASHNELRRQAQYKSWDDPEQIETRSNSMKMIFPNECLDILKQTIKENPKIGRRKIHKNLMSNDIFLNLLKESNKHLKRNIEKLSGTGISQILKERFGYEKGLNSLREEIFGVDYLKLNPKFKPSKEPKLYQKRPRRLKPRNHKITSIEIIDDNCDVYCMTVVGPNNEQDRHNFAILTNDEYMGTQHGGIFVKNSILDDYWLPVRGQNQGTKIESLAGGQHVSAVEDVQYMQSKLFSALKIPKPYINYDDNLCLVSNTKIPLLLKNKNNNDIDFSGIEIGALATSPEYQKLIQEGNLWAYSTKLDGSVVPGKIKNCWETKNVNKLVKVTLDNDEVVECTENHPFLMRNGEYVRADELREGDSLMPIYRKISGENKWDKLKGYEMVFDNKLNKWVYTHTMVAKNIALPFEQESINEKVQIVHHVDHNKLNNNPNNLYQMGKESHYKMHARQVEFNIHSPKGLAKLNEMRETDEFWEKHLEGINRAWANEAQATARKLIIANTNKKEKKIEKMHTVLSEMRLADPTFLKGKNASNYYERPKIEDIIEAIKNGITNDVYLTKHLQCSYLGLKEVIKANYGSTVKSFIKEIAIKNNIPLAKKRYTTEINFCDLADIAATSKNASDFYVNSNLGRFTFNTACIKQNVDKKTWFSENLNKGNHKVKSIEVIVLDTPIPVYDLEIEEHHNFLLGAGVVVHNSAKAALSQLDIRLSRTIQSYQKILIAELNKMAMIHLYVKGFDGPDLINFELKLSNPSSVALQQKLELWSVKFEIGGAAKETRLVDESWIQRNILELTGDEIKDIEKGLRKDQIRIKELEDMELKMPDKSLPPKTTGIFDPSSYDVPGSDVPKTPAPPITNSQVHDSGDSSDDKPSPREVALSKYKSQDENGNVVDLDIKKAPIKATPFLTRYKKNRNRREGISTGTQNAAMPDINAMVTQRNKYTQDVYGQKYESTNTSITKQTQLLESMDDLKIRTLKDLGQDRDRFNIQIEPVLTNNMRSVFKNLDVYLESHPGNKKNLLTENMSSVSLEDLSIETDGEDLLLEITDRNKDNKTNIIEKVKEKSLTDILNEDDDS